MNITPPEVRRVKITTDVQSTSAAKLQNLGASHPFTRQIDVIFPSSDVLESTLWQLKTRYSAGRVRLADVVDSAGAFSNFFLEPERCFTMLSTDAHGDDVWCIDPRGLLTLQVSKETYERLGLVGKRLPFKSHSEYHVIRLPLQKNAESVANRARRNESLKAWDARREQEGLGPWNMLYCSANSSLPEPAFAVTEVREVHCQMTKFDDVHIPVPSLRQHPSAPQSRTSASPAARAAGDEEDEVEDWNTEMAALFEWVGMACLGSQRLKANDRVDPYVAVYECPSPSYIGNVTHLRWTGFLGPDFVQLVVDTALAAVRRIPPNTTEAEKRPFVAITAHACSASPVSYIPPSLSSAGAARSGDGPTRFARAEGEDTWCLFAMPGSADSEALDWAMVESVGQYDTRWG
ncbi:putative ribonuclease P 40kDa (Rpp40) subunit [Lyophyllum shimeji]|uniref:Ribonuclease P 40kDa (Rpp40) subunit n=1 Tax=Lyophyllum shimeji TaxID=47721 RepID=A0A9P3PU67_LYOSH|nr:putative ribonuclease P 40kDa (Rpp40) subunit [Lyophyllum shimeji]